MTRRTSSQRAIEVVRARTHNLKNLCCRIPHGQVTVVTGLSGAGKSSLAFDTVYAEAQRRFVESMSTYARQFLEQMERPPVEAMNNILPAVALEARNSVKNARSTVGTLTEVWDVLRLLYTHLGEVGCPHGHGLLERHSAEQASDVIASGKAGRQVLLLAHLPRPRREANTKLRELVRQGYGRRFDDGEVVRMTPSQRWLKVLDPLPLVIGRFKAGGEASSRLVSAVEEAYQLTGGKLLTLDLEGEVPEVHFGRALTCGVCGAKGRRPTPALFSFNSPLGACPACQGFGRVTGIDRGRVIPDPSLSLGQRSIAVWNSPAYTNLYDELFFGAREAGISLDTPYEELSEAEREWVWSGDGPFTNLDDFFAWAERRNYKVHMRVLLARYRAYNRCPSCDGRRLRPEALGVRVKGESLPDLGTRSVEQLRDWFGAQRFRREERARAGHLLDQLEERLETLHRVGLDYLTLDRQARTLSGGEAQRIQLTAALGSGLTSTLYVLDEPTIGLHPSDSRRLLDLLHDLASRGNTVLVVEHDPTLIRGADHIIDLGPRAGEHGGELMAEGSLKKVLANKDSLTAQYLEAEGEKKPGRERPASTYGTWIEEAPRVVIRGAAEHNLRGFDVEIPVNGLVAVTGVSGSGKSTLIENVLYGTAQRARGKVDVEPGACSGLSGLDEVQEIVLVDQRPLGRSSRSNPVTYLKVYDEIRKLFAKTPAARERGIAAGHFSFNLDRGRCPECNGTGVQEVDMHFMASVTVTCDACQGHRFRPQVLEVTCRGRNIAETLELTAYEALEVFADRGKLCRQLETLVDVGLGYLRLGQPTSTLSGGEAQRLKLASFLGRPHGGFRLFLFDEPTTGLHLADIDLLHQTFRKLTSSGQGVVVVEHSLELISRADWIIDLGPGGGIHGGDLLFSGPTEEFLDGVESSTAQELRQHLKWKRRKSRKKSASQE